MQGELIFFSLSKPELENFISEAINKALTESKRADKKKELLNAKELCSWLGISLSTLNKWKAEDKIPYKRLGKRIFFQKSEIMKVLEDSSYFRLKELEEPNV